MSAHKLQADIDACVAPTAPTDAFERYHSKLAEFLTRKVFEWNSFFDRVVDSHKKFTPSDWLEPCSGYSHFSARSIVAQRSLCCNE